MNKVELSNTNEIWLYSIGIHIQTSIFLVQRNASWYNESTIYKIGVQSIWNKKSKHKY